MNLFYEFDSLETVFQKTDKAIVKDYRNESETRSLIYLNITTRDKDCKSSRLCPPYNSTYTDVIYPEPGIE